jgi:hypothetical protein
MKQHVLAIAVALTAGLTLSACATNKSRFEWGNYEGSLYAYAKKPDAKPKYKEALERAIDTGRKTNRVAPGLLAELGYLYLEDGDVAHATPLFEEEMQRFPESRVFLAGVVTRAKGAPTDKAASTDKTQSSAEVKS